MSILFTASQEDGTLDEWQNISTSDSGGSIEAVQAADDGIPAADGSWVARAKLDGGGSDYSRTIFQHDEAGVAQWGEGTDVWYAADFYLPDGFYASKNSSKDILRWDSFINGSSDIQGGLGMGADNDLRIMSNYPYTEPLRVDDVIPEEVWTRVEVHQIISEQDGTALNEIYVDGDLVGSSRESNYKGSAYPADERGINRLRAGLVSEGDVDDANTLYYDDVIISTTREGSSGGGGEPDPEPDPDSPTVIIIVIKDGEATRIDLDDLGAFDFSALTAVISPEAAAVAAPELAGTNGANELRGTLGADRIFGRGGDDTIRARAGDDFVAAGAGNDRVLAGLGDDNVLGGAGNDRLFGQIGRDVLSGGAGDDIVTGGLGADVVDGGAGADRFEFQSILESNRATTDLILDFNRAEGDLIDLRSLNLETRGVTAEDITTYVQGGDRFLQIEADATPGRENQFPRPAATFLLRFDGNAALDPSQDLLL